MQKVNRKTLLDIFTSLRPGISTKEISEHSDSIIFKNGLAWSCNDEIAISHPLPEGIDLAGAVLAEPLIKLLDRIEEEWIEIETTDKELQIHSNFIKAGLSLKIAETYLVETIPMPKNKDWMKIPEGMVKLLLLAAKSASVDMSRPVLTNLLIKDKQIISCNNRSLTVCWLKDSISLPLLPAAAVPPLSSFEPDMVSITKGWIHFANEKDCILSCRHGTGDYPDISKLLQVKGEEVKFPKELSSALERAGIFSATEFDSDQLVSLSIKEEKLKVGGRGPMGWFEEILPMPGKAVFEFSVHPEYLSTALDFNRKMIVGKTSLLLRGKKFIHVVSI